MDTEKKNKNNDKTEWIWALLMPFLVMMASVFFIGMVNSLVSIKRWNKPEITKVSKTCQSTSYYTPTELSLRYAVYFSSVSNYENGEIIVPYEFDYDECRLCIVEKSWFSGRKKIICFDDPIPIIAENHYFTFCKLDKEFDLDRMDPDNIITHIKFNGTQEKVFYAISNAFEICKVLKRLYGTL